jgi:hypothetical protein
MIRNSYDKISQLFDDIKSCSRFGVWYDENSSNATVVPSLGTGFSLHVATEILCALYDVMISRAQIGTSV